MDGKEIRESAEKNAPKKKKYRRNFVDVLIIFLIAASVVSFFFRGRIESTVNRFLADDSTTVRFVITDLEADRAADFGGHKKFTYKGADFGYLQEFTVRAATDRLVNIYEVAGSQFANVEMVADPLHSIVEGTFLIQGSQKDSGFYLGGNTKIAAGMTFEVCAKEQKYTILITKIG